MSNTDLASGAMRKLDIDVKNLADSILKAKNEATSYQIVLKAWTDQTNKTLDSIQSLTKLMQYNQYMAETLTNTYSKQIKVASDFQQALYKQSALLKGSGTDYANLAQAQNAYLQQVKALRHETGLSQVASEKLIGTVNQAYAGIRTKEALGDLQQMASAFAKVGLNAEEAAANMQLMHSAASKYAEVSRVMAAYNQGGKASEKDLSNIRSAVMMGDMSIEQYNAMNTIRASSGSAGSKIGSHGRETAVKSGLTTEAINQVNFGKMYAGSQMGIVKTSQDIALNRAQAGIGQSELNGALQVTQDTAAGVQGVLKEVTPVLNAVAGLRGKPAPDGSDGSAGGTGGVSGSSVSGADGQRVFVTNWAMIAGGGALGGFGRGGAGGAGGAGAGAAATNSLLGKIVGLLASNKGMGVVGGVATALTEEGSWGEKLTKGVVSGVGTFVGGSIAGPVGAIVLGGLASKYSDKIYHGVFGGKTGDTSKNNNVVDDTVNKDLVANGEEGQGTNAPDDQFAQAFKEKETEFAKVALNLRKYSVRAESFGSMAGAYGTLPVGFGSQQKAMLQGQSGELGKTAEFHMQNANIWKDMASKLTGDDKVTAMAKAREEETKAITASLTSSLKRKEALDAENKQLIEIAGTNTSESRAVKDLNVAKRMGMGQSYQDTANVVRLLGTELAAFKKQAAESAKLAAQLRAEGKTQEAQNQDNEAKKARTQALQKETEMYNEAKGIREGYLSAFTAEIGAMGAYAELLPSQEHGIQLMENSLALGGTGVKGVSAPGKYTTSGLVDNLDERKGLTNKLLGGTEGLIMGQSQDLSAVIESGVGLKMDRISTTMMGVGSALEKTASVKTGTSASNPTYIKSVDSGGYSAGSSGGPSVQQYSRTQSQAVNSMLRNGIAIGEHNEQYVGWSRDKQQRVSELLRLQEESRNEGMDTTLGSNYITQSLKEKRQRMKDLRGSFTQEELNTLGRYSSGGNANLNYEVDSNVRGYDKQLEYEGKEAIKVFKEGFTQMVSAIKGYGEAHVGKGTN